jgi:dimeric dUTPase (all-alpha-NTP-PPase superfamily)
MELKNMDKLDKIFDMQNELSKVTNLGNPRYPDHMSGRVSALCVALIHEIVELQRHTDWKWWKQPIPMDIKEAKEECIDIWHFLVQVSLELGLSPEEILQVYKEKNKENHERQKNGY